MCAQYNIRASQQEIEAAFNLASGEKIDWKERIVPHAPAPVAVNGKLELMNFSLIPSWSKDRKPKFVTYNARLDGVLEKPTWKTAFVKRHCVVPMSSFIEPVYVSKKGLEGNMVSFSGPGLLLAAGIWEEWKDQTSGEVVRSFAVVTNDPSDYVQDVGHDRQPVFLEKERAVEWLKNEGTKGEDLRTFLKECADEPNFSTAVDRPMVKGWEKRIPKE